jgi:glutamate dehydrogenase
VLDPAALMKAILKAPAELLYFGGIGTYVKAPTESDAQVGDKANDAIRIDGGEVRAKVIGEGANLGLTQAGRIAFARSGGRINTDAIDNSAGVDSSDHEVNIKILTGAAIASGSLKADKRDALLASMTDEVGLKVLAHNYDQTLAISLQEAEGAPALDSQQRFMQWLGSKGKLDRKVEGLPDDLKLAEMKASGQALTRPELAVLTAYSKLELFDDIVASAAPDDAFFKQTLVRYFPAPLAKYEADMQRHRLRREIISTILSNEIVNMAGPTFPERLRQATRCDTGAMVIAFEAARQIFRLDEAWDAVSALDRKIPAAAQMALYREIATVLRRQTFFLARRAMRKGCTVGQLIEAYRPAAARCCRGSNRRGSRTGSRPSSAWAHRRPWRVTSPCCVRWSPPSTSATWPARRNGPSRPWPCCTIRSARRSTSTGCAPRRATFPGRIISTVWRCAA